MKYADKVNAARRDRNLSIRDLADAAGVSYEHCRRIASGVPSVSAGLNLKICRTLGLDPTEMWREAVREKITERYGLKLRGQGLDRRAEELVAIWQRLPTADQGVLLRVARSLSRNRRADSAESPPGSD